MFRRLAAKSVSCKYLVIILFAALAAALHLAAPPLRSVTNDQQFDYFGKEEKVVKGSLLEKKAFPDSKAHGSVTVVFHGRDNGRLEDDAYRYMGKLEKWLRDPGKGPGTIETTQSPLTEPDLKDRYVSKDGTVALLTADTTRFPFRPGGNGLVDDIRRHIAASDKPEGLDVNVTGDMGIGRDYTRIDERSTAMTAILVIVILIALFRSPATPIVPLATIGLSFVSATAVVALCAKAGMNVSSYTEKFLTAIIFGAGTDYCLFLISRYKEYLHKGLHPSQAVIAAMGAVGEAMVSSASTVIVGFLSMLAASFGLYRNIGPAVAIGVAVTLVYTIAFTPALIACLGDKVFWPGTANSGADDKRRTGKKPGTGFTWERLANAVSRRPGIILMGTALVLAVPALQIRGLNRSFDSVSELSEKSDARRGFEVIQKHFGAQETMPVKVLLSIRGRDLRSPEMLNAIYRISDDIAHIEGVSQVRSAAWPGGTPDDLGSALLDRQIGLYADGLEGAKDGLAKLSNALEQLESGSKSLVNGFDGARDQLSAAPEALRQAINGSAAVADGLKIASEGSAILADKLSEAGKEAQAGRLEFGSLVRSGGSARTAVNALGESHPELLADPAYQNLSQQLKSQSLPSANLYAKLATLETMLGELAAGADQLSAANARMADGAGKLAAGLGTIGNNAAGGTGGNMADQVRLAASSVSKLSEGISAANSGMAKLEAGIGSAAKGLSTLGNSVGRWGFGQIFVPEASITKGDLGNALKHFISSDGKTARMYVLLKDEPYSIKAMNLIPELERNIRESMSRAGIQGDVYLTGTTSTTETLREMTNRDFLRVAGAVLLGIFAILSLLLRSVVAPVYLILTVILSYATSLGLTTFLFEGVLGQSGISWMVPFFLFIFLVALGVDYNIFLMSRVREESALRGHTGGVVEAVTHTGGIITACGIIMAGTFSVLMTSSLMNLIQLGFAVTVGILIDTFIVRSTLVPSLVTLLGRGNWWPSRMSRNTGSQTAEKE